MSEETIKSIKEEIENETDAFHWFDDILNNLTRKQLEAVISTHQCLLDLYNKEKEKNIKLQKELEEIKVITNAYDSFYANTDNKIVLADKEYFDSGFFIKKYILKDKIKERISKINKTYPKETMFSREFLITELQELLEE